MLEDAGELGAQHDRNLLGVLDTVLGERGGMRGQPLAPGTLARVHVVLRAALAQAMRWGWIWDNPAERAHRIVATRPELNPPTPEELGTLLKYLADGDPALHTFVTLAAFTGGRRAQLLALRWRNVDLDAGRLSFTGGWVEGPDGPVLAATKTKRRHAVDHDPGSVEVLAAHADRVRTASGGRLRREGFVFSDDPDGAVDAAVIPQPFVHGIQHWAPWCRV